MAQKKPAGKPIKITLTEAQISDIIQRAAKTRRSVRVESLEDRIAPSRIGLPVFGGAEDLDKLDDSGPLPEVPGEIFPEGGGDGLPGEIFPDGGPDVSGDSLLDDPKDGLEDPFAQTPLTDPDPNAIPLDPNLPGDTDLPVDPVLPVDPDAPLGVDAVDAGDPQPTLDEAANVEFNENLHMQGDTPDSGLTQGEMEEHRLNILRQLRS